MTIDEIARKFRQLQNRVSAPNVPIEVGMVPVDRIITLEKVNEIRTLWNGAFVSDDWKRGVVLYIVDQHSKFRGKESEYKYHIANCSTLEKYQKKGMQDRYNARNIMYGAEDKFPVRIDEKETCKIMHVCKNCLMKVNYLGYRDSSISDRETIYNSFNAYTYFKNALNEFLPKVKYSVYEDPGNMYPPNWAEISKKIKQERGYKCEKCNSVLPPNSNGLNSGLEVHHIDARKNNCLRGNLIVLCSTCHKEVHEGKWNIRDINR